MDEESYKIGEKETGRKTVKKGEKTIEEVTIQETILTQVPSAVGIEENGDATITVKKEHLPENLSDLVTAVVTNSTRREEIEKTTEKTSGRRIKVLCLVLVLLLVPLLTKSCKHTENFVEQHREEFAIVIEAGIQNPGVILEGVIGQAGQEEMTNSYVLGDYGAYSAGEQINRENAAVETYTSYESTNDILEEALQVLSNPEATQDELQQALQTIEATLNTRVEIRDEVAPEIEANVAAFAEAARANPDARTEIEIEIVEDMQTEFEKDTITETQSRGEVQAVNDAVEGGATLENIQVVQNEDGEYQITGEQVTEVVKQQTHTGLKAFWENIKDWFGKIFNTSKETTKETNETER